MDDVAIKQALMQVHDCNVDFSVTLTGKRSNRVNGLYKPDTQEILLHNRNFTNDNQLMYTAIHELTHHIMSTELNQKSKKSHSGPFWATFENLIDRAVKLKIYSRERSEDTRGLVKKANELHKKITALQMELGVLLVRLHKSCDVSGERYEDVVASDLQLDRATAKTFCNMAVAQTPVPFAVQEVMKNCSTEQKRQVLDAAQSGKTFPQIKAASMKIAQPCSEYAELKKECDRLERTIQQLTTRYEEVTEQLQGLQTTDVRGV